MHGCPDGAAPLGSGRGDYPPPIRLADRPRVLFTVRRQYYTAIAAGEKTLEIRSATGRWRTVASRAPGTAVFLCGRSVHRREIVGVREYPSAEAALGRPPSPQGALDLGDGPVLAFELGPPIPAA